jgi:cytoskeletal protein CcmA (bactofilin family)
MSTSPVPSPNRSVRCPICGSERLKLRSERDPIDRLYQTPSDRVRRLFVSDMQLYHCRVCRLQFYDDGQAAQPAVQTTAEPARETTPTAEITADGLTLVGQAVTIRGRLSSQESIFVNGEIEGDIEIPAQRLTIGISGRMRGDVLAGEVVALGTIEGNIDARRFVIRASARVTGNIRCPSLSIEEGAYFKGRIETA